MKVYIVTVNFYNDECSWSEIAKVCKNKERAEFLILQYEEDCEECSRQLKEFDEETRSLMDRKRYRTLLASERANINFFKERNNLKNKMRSDWAKKGKYWYEGCGESPSFEINEYEVDED